jgi:hypothetical protein
LAAIRAGALFLISGNSTTVGDGAHGSFVTRRWREMDSNFQFLVARPSNRHGRSDRFLETWSGSVGEPEVRIHLPPAASRCELDFRVRIRTDGLMG